MMLILDIKMMLTDDGLKVIHNQSLITQLQVNLADHSRYFYGLIRSVTVPIENKKVFSSENS